MLQVVGILVSEVGGGRDGVVWMVLDLWSAEFEEIEDRGMGIISLITC